MRHISLCLVVPFVLACGPSGLVGIHSIREPTEPDAPIDPQELTGKIVFDEIVSGEGFQIFVMNADGSGVTRLTHTNGSKVNPGWSPDGSRIVFQRFGLFGGDIHVMNADGTGNTTIRRGSWSHPDWSPDGSQIVLGSTSTLHVMNADGTDFRMLLDFRQVGQPDWSPDGERIVFYHVEVNENPEIFVVNADGTGLMNLTNHPQAEEGPAWSPDGTKIAFTGSDGIFVMNADGTGQTRLMGDNGFSPTWSPDGTKIAFTGSGGIYVMNADGSQRTRIHEGSTSGSPDWHCCNH